MLVAGPPPSVDLSSPSIPYYAVRNFIGPAAAASLSVDGVAYLALPQIAVGGDAGARLHMICEVYVTTFSSVGDMAGQPGKRFVTLWPLEDEYHAANLNNKKRSELLADDDCADAVEGYGLDTADIAIEAARRSADKPALNGRGPFLLAWTPAEERGKDGSLALVLDLSGVDSRENIETLMAKWKRDVVQTPELWDNGWDVDRLKVAITEMLESIGPGLVAFSSWFMGEDDE
ncbi:hypothetical protein [Kordiimonas aestuarii]|uniref:hypothetical protein n=1 Tax=Kordiimonas aestuarii TaxID=1005925 RepID=UPI0021D360E7|nr:hypothetical protein [Kordiimonas aestuarii]